MSIGFLHGKSIALVVCDAGHRPVERGFELAKNPFEWPNGKI